MKNKNFDYNWIGDKNTNTSYQYVKMAICIILIIDVAFSMWYCL